MFLYPTRIEVLSRRKLSASNLSSSRARDSTINLPRQPDHLHNTFAFVCCSYLHIAAFGTFPTRSACCKWRLCSLFMFAKSSAPHAVVCTAITELRRALAAFPALLCYGPLQLYSTADVQYEIVAFGLMIEGQEKVSYCSTVKHYHN